MKSSSLPAGEAPLLAATVTVDITPSLGIHMSNWAIAPDSTATGVHRPLLGKLLAFESPGRRSLLVALDLGWWMSADDEWRVRDSVHQATGLGAEAVIVCLTHTHAGPSINRADGDRAGGHHIAAYLNGLEDALSEAARDVWEDLEPVEITWVSGVCGLAVNRDLRLADGRFVIGQNPEGLRDDTLVLGAVRRPDGSYLALVCNYAVHPTSLGAGNSLLSPDLVGRARELVEADLGGSFVFLQGASGDLSPRVQYSAHTIDADRNGEALGHAVLSTLAAFPRSGRELTLSEVVESGAPLGLFEESALESARRFELEHRVITLETQGNQPPGEGADVGSAVLTARRSRADRVRGNVEEVETSFSLVVWRIGSAVIFAYPGEAYSQLARDVRARHPGRTIVFINLANGAHQGYLAPRDAYVDGRYPAWQSPLAAGSLERLTDACNTLMNEEPFCPSRISA